MKSFIMITWFTADGKLHNKIYHQKKSARKFAIKLSETDNTRDREWCEMDYSLNIIDEFSF